MMDYLPGIIFLLLFAVGVFAVLKLSLVFYIKVVDGRVVASKGKSTPAYEKDVERICELWSLKNGWIKGIRSRNGVRITTGGDLAGKHRRAFQNAWDHPM